MADNKPNRLLDNVALVEVLKNRDVLFAVGLVSVIIMMFVPLPAIFLDIMLAVNIALALTILLVSIYTKDALEFSVFPSLLLIATVFRLGLNVSTTRLILMGEGAKIGIVSAFGNFVVGGNYVVGFVMFLIIVIFLFVVITKGAERVAEVAARFTLDAMPMKHMAIDAEVNAGSIDADEARRRRRNVEREADFYGAMDGASKFVKGDAIAGIIILVINILGGFAIGVLMRGETMAEAIQAYTLFTVGDGLVTQIPAFLIATASGLVVTRAGSESNLGTELTQQLVSNPKVLSIAAAMMLFLGMIPGLPKISFLFLGTLFGTVAYIMHQSAEQEIQAKADEKEKEAAAAPAKPEDVTSLLSIDQLELEIGYNLIPLVDTNQGGDLLNRITLIRRQIAIDLGLVVPPIRIRDNIQLPPSVYVVKIKGVEIDRYEIIPDQLLAMNPGTVTSPLSGIEVIEPAFGLPAIWIPQAMRERAEMAGYTVVDPSTVIATHLTEMVRKNAHEILGRQELQSLLDTVRNQYPLIVDEVVPKVISHPLLLKVLQNLLREGVSIRNMVTILEALADCGGVNEVDTLTEIVRQALSRHICKNLADETGVLNVVSLDPRLEQLLTQSLQKIEGSVQLALDPKIATDLLGKIKTKIEEVMQEGRTPILLCSGMLRLSLKRLTERMAPRLTVLSYNEIPTTVQLQSTGLVSLG
ncbi:MAG TPA: flagellar biosynthesis protein FlhA [Candidatus Ozemobacteraceae bacterium]|nr:flagellar biosynthesis protein FlhA [Candidatus Ozemobacteraceae bacterium]